MEIVDEIMTPGCPNCYVKHMTAALACMAINKLRGEQTVPYAAVTLARAYINLVEAREGYASHRDLAIGMIAHAELVCGDAGCTEMREIRVGLMTGDPFAERRLLGMVDPVALFMAHLKEAERELPSASPVVPYEMTETCVVFPDLGQGTADAILAAVAEVRREYFAEPAVGEAYKEKEGGQDMACAKKAKCAAAKGGAVAKTAAKAAAAKGGKCAAKKSCKK